MKDILLLCKSYTHLWNQAQRYWRSEHFENLSLHSAAFIAKQKYHDTLWKQKKQHWEGFLNEPGNIWEICYYINKNFNQASFT